MKILIVNNQNVGFFGTRSELVRALLENGDEVCISSPDGNSGIPDEFKTCKVLKNSISRFGTNPLKELSVVRNLKKQIMNVAPDVILTYTIKPNLYTLMAVGCNRPVIINVTGLSAFLFRKGIVPKLVAAMQTKLFMKAYCVFCQNMSTYLSFEKLGLKNLSLLPGSGVNLDTVKIKPFPEFSGRIECCFVARVQKDKGYLEFIEASKRLSDWHFTVIGDGEDKTIVDAFKDCPNITYLGKLPHDETLMKVTESHVLILPSYHEGMANVILEAHALGRPVLTTNVAGCIDAIEDGKTGISFVPKSSDAIIDACNRFASFSRDEWKQMGVEGRRFVEENFDRRIVVDEYMKAIREAMGK